MSLFKILRRNFTKGHVKDLGGKFAERETGMEEEFFYKKNKAAIEAIRKRLKDKLAHDHASHLEDAPQAPNTDKKK